MIKKRVSERRKISVVDVVATKTGGEKKKKKKRKKNLNIEV